MKLSIITVNKNNTNGLEKTIQSVSKQTFTDYEYIVIDGVSEDGSVEIIKKYADKITYWISEPDTGIYNAMNKGIKKASGDYCLFLNSGDCLIAGTTLKNAFREIDGQADIYYSDTLTTHNNTWKYPDELDVNFFLRTNINHQNTIIRRLLFNSHGYYNEKLRVVSDLEFYLKEIWFYNSRFVHLKTKITKYNMDGISSTTSLIRQEYPIVLDNVFGKLSASLRELNDLKNKKGLYLYYDIVRNYGESKIFVFILRLYRYFMRRFKFFSRSGIKVIHS
jgi:glycosyltransferase involved in cell wall biosynthesis